MRHPDEFTITILSPLALDMEWRVFFRRQRNLTSARALERRIAVVQVADTRGVILVVQVYGMTSMLVPSPASEPTLSDQWPAFAQGSRRNYR